MQSLCCIGHLSRDVVVTPRGSVSLTGGVAYYFSHAIACLPPLGTYTLVTRCAEDGAAAVAALREKGVAVHVLPSPATVAFENCYGDDPDARQQRVVATAAPFTAADVEDVAADCYHLGSLLADDFPLSVVEALRRRGATISVDVQGFLRRVVGTAVVATAWRDAAAFLREVDIVKVNDEELRALTGCASLADGMRQVAAWGPDEVVATLGSRGAVVLAHGTTTVIPAFAVEDVVDTTGCGDTFMAGYLYCRVQGAAPAVAGRFAAAMCALKIARHGPFCDSIAAVRQVMATEKESSD